MDKGERAGTGIRRMNEAMAAAGLPKPDIHHDDLFFFISFQRPFADTQQSPSLEKGSDKKPDGQLRKNLIRDLEKGSEKIFNAIKNYPQISARELSVILGISTRAVEKRLAQLKKTGILRRVGPDRGGHWEIVNV